MYIILVFKKLYIAFINLKCIKIDVCYFYTCINVTCQFIPFYNLTFLPARAS